MLKLPCTSQKGLQEDFKFDQIFDNMKMYLIFVFQYMSGYNDKLRFKSNMKGTPYGMSHLHRNF